MTRSKVFLSLAAIVCLCAIATTSFAKKPPCPFKGDYSFYFWDPDTNLAGVGYFTVSLKSPACRAGTVVPGGIIDCNIDSEYEYEEFIDSGTVGIESDGEGRMTLTGSTNQGICDTGYDTLVLDISVVLGGKTVLFNSNGQPGQAGNDITITGRADKCFAGPISGCYDMRFWEPADSIVGDCTICLNGAGVVTGGQCQCNNDGHEYLSSIIPGFYAQGNDACQSQTGFMDFHLASQPLCGITSEFVLDFAVAQQGKEIIGACDSFNSFNCVFEGYLF